jgi:hypothetical protein
MKCLVRKSVVLVLGKLWLPMATAGTEYVLSKHDVENCRDQNGKVTRASVEDWLGSHAGDFSSVTDFSASIEDGDATIDIPWADEGNEMTYHDCVYGGDE